MKTVKQVAEELHQLQTDIRKLISNFEHENKQVELELEQVIVSNMSGDSALLVTIKGNINISGIS